MSSNDESVNPPATQRGIPLIALFVLVAVCAVLTGAGDAAGASRDVGSRWDIRRCSPCWSGFANWRTLGRSACCFCDCDAVCRHGHRLALASQTGRLFGGLCRTTRRCDGRFSCGKIFRSPAPCRRPCDRQRDYDGAAERDLLRRLPTVREDFRFVISDLWFDDRVQRCAQMRLRYCLGCNLALSNE